MMTDTPELLPCPFCGGDKAYTQMSGAGYRIICDNCRCSTGHHSNADAIAAWNRRAPSPDATDDLNRMAQHANALSDLKTKAEAELAEVKRMLAEANALISVHQHGYKKE